MSFGKKHSGLECHLPVIVGTGGFTIHQRDAMWGKQAPAFCYLCPSDFKLTFDHPGTVFLSGKWG